MHPHEHPHQHGPLHGHSHGHPHDHGVSGFLRYLAKLPMLWRSEVNDEVVRLVAPTPRERVVDLGAGLGAATMAAVRTGATVVAVDPMPYMRLLLGLRLRVARARGQAEVLEGAAEAIPVADGSIDALWTVNTLHHWTQLDKAAQELARVMRPGGRVILLDEDLEASTHPHRAELERRNASKHLHFTQVDPEALAEGLRQAGFAMAQGSRTTLAGRPVKLVQAVR